MHDAEVGYGEGDAPLTAHERGRLRAGVDAAALERFLVAGGGVGRRALLAHFAAAATPDDARAALREAGAGAEVAALERGLSALAAEVPPSAVSHDVLIAPPEAPALRALWDAIEPGRAEADGAG